MMFLGISCFFYWSHCEIYCFVFFFFHDTPPTEFYTLSLHDALPIFEAGDEVAGAHNHMRVVGAATLERLAVEDRKSTRLNSSHSQISYAVFCLKKKKKKTKIYIYKKQKNNTI